MAEILEFTGITKHDISAQKMLRYIAKESPDFAFVIAWPKDGSMPTYHSNTGDIAVVMHRLQEFIHKYYNGEYRQ